MVVEDDSRRKPLSYRDLEELLAERGIGVDQQRREPAASTGPRRFLDQVTALVRHKEPRAVKIGGRGLWRIGRDDLESYLERTCAETERWIEGHPLIEGPSNGDLSARLGPNWVLPIYQSLFSRRTGPLS